MANDCILQGNPMAPGSLSPNFTELGQEMVNSVAGNIFSLRPMGKYMTGARCIIKVNGKLAGFAFQISWNIKTMQDEIWAIDDYTPVEYAPKRITVDGTIGMFHIPGKGPSKELIQSNILSFLMHKYITIEAMDQRTGEILFKTEKAVITGRSQTIAADQISQIQLTWKAIGWRDELQPSLPSGYDQPTATPDVGTPVTVGPTIFTGDINVSPGISATA